jgi:hypothetical protein
MAALALGEGLACWRRANAAPRLAWGLLNVGSPASSNSRPRSRAHGVPPGAAPPPAFGHGSHWLGSDTPPRNLSCRPMVGRSLKPPGRAAGWISDRWGRCGSEPSGTCRRPETWEPVQRLRRRAPGGSSFVAGSHGECVVCPYGRCTTRLAGRNEREFRPSGRQMVTVAQIGSGPTSLPDERTRRWMAANRKGRSCGATHLPLSVGLFHRSGGFPPSCR